MLPGILQAKWAEVKIHLNQYKETLPIGPKWQQEVKLSDFPEVNTLKSCEVGSAKRNCPNHSVILFGKLHKRGRRGKDLDNDESSLLYTKCCCENPRKKKTLKKDEDSAVPV